MTRLAPLVSGLADLGAWQSGHIVIHLSGASGVGLLGAAAGAGRSRSPSTRR